MSKTHTICADCGKHKLCNCFCEKCYVESHNKAKQEAEDKLIEKIEKLFYFKGTYAENCQNMCGLLLKDWEKLKAKRGK